MSDPVATILIVDDEAQNRKLLEMLLWPEGYALRSAADGEAALASVAEQAPDLILLDVMMPGMNGYEVATRLKADPATASIPIIMVTALIDRDARLAGLNAGVEEFMTKPVDRSELWLRVRNLLRLKLLGDFFQNHSAILEQRVLERTADVRRFGSAMDATADAIYVVDRASMAYVHVNDAACRMQGETREALLAHGPSTLLDTPLAELEQSYDVLIAGGDGAKPVEVLRTLKDGSQAWLELRRHAHRSGEQWTIVTLARDVTARREADAKIKRLNRLYTVLSGINTLIVRVRERDDLFREACRIAVRSGRFENAWISIVDNGAKQITPVASAGAHPDLMAEVLEPLSDHVSATAWYGPSAMAVRNKQAVICNDVETDPRFQSGESLLARGIRSFAVLPLLVAGEPAAVLGLQAAEAGFFDEVEMNLLLELAGDIAFAIDNINKQARVDYLAYYDALTGLANRRLLLERLAQCMRSAASGEHKAALYLIDLERFKNINDSLGQPFGDALLRQVAEWLTEKMGHASLLARVGVDHFAVLVPMASHADGVARKLEQLMAAFQEHAFRLNNAPFRIAFKAGVALYPDDGTDADSLFRNAEAALKKAKSRSGGERYLFYTQRMTETVAGNLTLENQLRQALENEEFVLHYQPKVSLETGKVTGAEALIRWLDPRNGLVPPGRFVPILEETGIIYDVGRWALRKAVDEYLRWRNAGLAAVPIAVNVSPLQLRNRGFVATIQRIIDVNPHAAAGLELEITESLIMEDVKYSFASLQAIRVMGVTVAIDDFGTGFSSLSYLAKLPVDTLKIDRSFVVDMTAGPQGLALVSTIIGLAHALRLKVVAEGVETGEQSRLLGLLTCNEMQGFLFSKPLPADAFETLFLAPRAADADAPLNSASA